jgi:hypothetical protein
MLHKILLEYSREYDISLQHAEDSYKIILKNLLNSIKNKNKDEISNFSKLLSKFIHILRIKKICDLNIKTKIYLPFFFDFRGRIYYLSDLSPTFYSEYRYCLHGGIYKTTETKFHYNNILIETELNK